MLETATAKAKEPSRFSIMWLTFRLGLGPSFSTICSTSDKLVDGNNRPSKTSVNPSPWIGCGWSFEKMRERLWPKATLEFMFFVAISSIDSVVIAELDVAIPWASTPLCVNSSSMATTVGTAFSPFLSTAATKAPKLRNLRPRIS